MKLRRKLIMSILSVLLLVMTLTTTTYAWFNTYSQVVVEGFNISVTGGKGFLISIDNIHYYNDLTKDKILSAIILSRDKLSEEPLYELKDEKLYLKGTDTLVTEAEKLSIISNMKLRPRTTQDGLNFEDLYGSKLSLLDNTYISFDVYFKQASENPDEGLTYDIYLLGEDKVLDDGTNVKRSNITSERLDVNLRSFLKTYDIASNEVISYSPGDILETYASNALRLSIYDESKFENQTDIFADIYEFPNEKDLGSYATTYKAEDDNISTEEEKRLKTKLYDCRYNAGYTYFNSLRNGLLLGEELKYERQNETDKVLPASIRNITNIDDLPTITRVSSGEAGKKVKFTIWLEGWDADCFDGIANNVNICLSFTSKKVESEN